MKGSKFTHEVMQPLRVESGLTQLDLEVYVLKAEVDRLTSGPGGIMEMKQTIADKEAEIERLRKYSMRYSQRVEQLYLLDSYVDGLVGEIERGVDMDRLKELAKIYRHNKESGLYE